MNEALQKSFAYSDELGWALDAQNAVNVDLHAELFKAKEYATTLTVSMHRQHYAEAAPNWQPLNDVLGLLTQIDNMYAGLRNDFADLEVENKRLVGMNLAGVKAERDAAVARNAMLEGLLREALPNEHGTPEWRERIRAALGVEL